MSMHTLAPKSRYTCHPTEVRILSNRIKVARKHHDLKCGCIHCPGHPYHEVVALVAGTFTIIKQHAGFGCIETLH